MSEEKDESNEIVKVRWSELSEMQIEKLRQENNELRTRVAKLEAEAKMGNIPYKEAVELKKRVAELENILENQAIEIKSQAGQKEYISSGYNKLHNRLSTLLKASEGMEKALEKCNELFSEIRGDWSDPRSQCREGWAVIASALADFRALKEMK